MNILIAPDSFKDCLPASMVAAYLKEGLLNISSNFEIRILPMADGGEGTLEAITEATQGKYLKAEVHDPLMRKIDALIGITGKGDTAIVEMARASGIELLKSNERNPWMTTSFGTGELIRAALDLNCQRIIVGLGGSSTNDAGVGMAMALGIKFLDITGKSIGFGGGALSNLSKIDISGLDQRIDGTEILVACDVTNPLTGEYGASFVYGPQKGADSKMVIELDKNLQLLSEVIQSVLGIDVKQVPGAGAAGGMGAGLMAFLNAKLVSGFELIKKETSLDEYCRWAEVIITGEGKIDAQTRYGKTPHGVAKTARPYNKKVIAIAGSLGDNYELLYADGFDIIMSIQDRTMPLAQAINEAPELLVKTGQRIGRQLL